MSEHFRVRAPDQRALRLKKTEKMKKKKNENGKRTIHYYHRNICVI